MENRYGHIDIKTEMGSKTVRWTVSSPTRAVAREDIQESNAGGEIQIIVHPKDDAQINLEVTIPHTAYIAATTSGGSISLTGLAAEALLKTETGAIKITTTWELTRFRVLSASQPTTLIKPKLPAMGFVTGKRDGSWAFANAWPNQRARYGDPLGDGWKVGWERSFSSVQVVAEKPARLELVNLPLPESSWIRFPSEAGSVLKNLWRILKAGRLPPSLDASSPQPLLPQRPTGAAEFKSDVRLVTLAVPIHDQRGRTVPGLTADDFLLAEDGAPQKIAFVNSGETPFNLVLLLDLSKSAYLTRPLVLKAAQEFVRIAQPRDRIAVHVLSNSLFHVVSPLSSDRARLGALIDTIPEVAGGSPIYDSIVLSSVQQPLNRPGEQSAIVILTDGMDNQLEAPERGSVVPFGKLRSAVAEWPIPIYTLLVPYEAPTLQVRGRRNMQQLADSSGGRLFEVSSLDKLSAAYEKVAEDLRSVYTIGYYPSNQDFNGAWRTVHLRSQRPGLALRTRPGYSAQ